MLLLWFTNTYEKLICYDLSLIYYLERLVHIYIRWRWKNVNNEQNRVFKGYLISEIYVSDVTEFKINQSDIRGLLPIKGLYNCEICYSKYLHATVRFTCKFLENVIY